MANMAQVNKAIRQRFPKRNIEAIRGDGYVWFYGLDTDGIASVFANPPTTPTEDMVQICIEEIERVWG
jgi:hypothetical protein